MPARRIVAASLLSLTIGSAMAGISEINGCPIRAATLCVEYRLAGADLRVARLAWANFSQSDLSGADLRKADLRNAVLHRYSLSP